LVTNANPVRMDPTRTTAIRRAFEADITRRFNKLMEAVRKFLDGDDELGLKTFTTRLTLHQREFQFRTDAGKLQAFNDWLKQQVEANLITPPPSMSHGPWTAKYIESAYKKGLINAYTSSKAGLTAEAGGIGGQSKESFLRSAFGQPEATSKVQLIATRALEDLKGVSATAAQRMNRILAQGMIDGKGPAAIAAEMSKQIKSLSKARAMLIARTEVISAHAEGQLDAFDELGVDELGVMAEWSTAGDDRVCPECASLEGQVFTVEEARGLIPKHPNCRCTWVPSTDKPTKAQRKAAVRRAALKGKGGAKAKGKGQVDELPMLEGHSIVSVVRGLGSQGVTFKEAKALFQQSGIQVADQTLRIQLKAGSLGQGSMAPGELLTRLRAGQITVAPPTVPTVPMPPPTPVVVPKPVPAPLPAPTPPKATTPALPKETTGLPAKRAEVLSSKTLVEREERLVTAARKTAGFDADQAARVNKEYSVALAEHDALTIRSQREPGTVTPEQLRMTGERVTRAQEAQKQMWALERKAWDVTGDVHNQLRDEVAQALKEADGLDKHVKFGSNIPTDHVAAYKQVLSWIPKDNLTASEIKRLGELNSSIVAGTGGSSYSSSFKNIQISKNHKDSVSVMAHEYGHHLSYQVPKYMRAQNQYFVERTFDEKVKTLPGYAKKIKGKKDKWFEPYAGRVYDSDGRYPEVITVAIEHLVKDPVSFAKRDPEYYDWIIGVLKDLK
jgi:SPP1 gp7 family putative phage head morphogenesis protein